MDIKIGEYHLHTDRYNYVISKPPELDKRGVKSYPDSAYYSTLPNAFNGLLERRLKKSDATTLTELKNGFLEHRDSLLEVFKGIED